MKSFLKFFKPSIILDITPIIDVYGPTSWDPNIQALIVSKETISGAEASMSFVFFSFRTIIKIWAFSSVTSHRQKHNLPPLQVFLIDVISATHSSLDHEDVAWLKDNKLSSTFIRQWIVNRDQQK